LLFIARLAIGFDKPWRMDLPTSRNFAAGSIYVSNFLKFFKKTLPDLPGEIKTRYGLSPLSTFAT